MKLYIKQRVFSLVDSYDIYDENQHPVYKVVAKFFSIGAKLTVSDGQGHELFRIEQKLFSFLPTYEVKQNDTLVATIHRKLSLFKPVIEIESINQSLTVEGNFIGWDFTIRQGNETIASIHKKFLSWGDTYELNLSDQSNPGLLVALVVAIDHSMHNQRRR